MEQNVRIADMEKGQLVQGFYLLEDVRCRVSASGSPYISARIADASGEMAAKLWNYNGPITEADSGRAVLLRGEVGEFAGAPQFTIQRIRLATEKDNFDRRALVPCAPLDPDEALAEVRELLASMGDGDYRTLCETMLERHLETFRSIPAAKSVHHAFLSGLLMHTLHMLRTADFFAALYAGVIDRDLLLAGAFLHDLGKETELGRSALGLVTEYTVPGRLLGHLYLGARETAALAGELGLPEEKSLLLQHLILSHHGQPEFGAAVAPQCAESELLALIDLTDSRMEIYAEALRNTPPGAFSPRVYALEKSVYRRKEPEEDGEGSP